ncbi:sugar transferase [Candidatus Poribacteria bacterium]|nr:sugar transferase [Candidatus Poribacteria bacterium]
MNKNFNKYPVTYSQSKRILDITISTFAIIILSPLIAIITFAIKLNSSGPVIFRQERCGLHEQRFVMLKFRTMIEGAQNMGSGYELVKNDYRITRVGKFLRDNSFDEIPQLFNVIKGHMSLVGPRPMIQKQVDKLNNQQRIRHATRPGITGWAQVNGRNSISWGEKIRLDIWYVKNWNFWLDVKILLKTLSAVTRKDDLYGEDGVNKAF